MVLEVGGHLLAGVQAGLELGMGDVAGYDDGALQVHAGAHGVFGELCADGVDALVQVYFNALGAFSGTAESFGDEFGGIAVHLLNPDTVGIDLGLDVAVCAAAHAHADGAAGTVAGQAHHADVMGQVFAAELGAQANLLGFLQEFLFQVYVAEGAAGLVTGGGQVVVELDAGQLHGEEVLFGRCSANHKGDVVRRAGRGAQRAHLLHQEGDEGAFVLDGGLGHGIEIGLVGAAAALGHHDKAVLAALCGLDVNLGGQVALGVYFIVHV